MSLGFAAKGRALRRVALDAGAGYSIGVSPWTDHLLAQTCSADKDSVVIVLGHDWYPIVPDDRPSVTPLVATDCLHRVERYWAAAPEAVIEGRTVGLFANLYPDYRPPGDPKCGNLSKYGYSYAQCLAGLDAMVGVWYRVIDPELADPAGKYDQDKDGMKVAIVRAIDQAEKFHTKILDTYHHPNTYAYYGADKEQLSYGVMRWITDTVDAANEPASLRGPGDI